MGEVTKAETVTPMMAQYLEIKAGYPDVLLFYRMGDFYEMFFDDAVAAAEALDIALTRRGKHLGDDIPMCGVPVHSAEGYFLTLIRKGFRVAVCEQLEDPAEAKKRGSKAVVKRDVVRLVTPGTLTEDSLLEARRHNYLASFTMVRDEGALAWVDISTGAVSVMACSRLRLGPELARLAPREVIVPETLEAALEETVADMGAALTPLGRSAFDSTNGETRLCALYGVASLDAFGNFGRAAIGALAGLIEYIDITQKGNMPLLRPPVEQSDSPVMQIDAATRRSLELTHANAGGRAGSLLSAIDRTVTAAGGRLLETRLSSPSCRVADIAARQAAVARFVDDDRFRADIRDALRGVHDLDRALSRLGLDRGGPRDMAAIRNTVQVAGRIAGLFDAADLPDHLRGIAGALKGHDALDDLLDRALVADPPITARDGGFIARGFDDDLDEARTLRDEGRGVIAGLQKKYAEASGIASLKIRHNNVLGYFIETTSTHADGCWARR